MTSLAPNILDEDVLLSDVDPTHIASAHSPVSEQELRKYLVAFGGESTSYFHLQDGVDYFHLRGIGFMSYREERTLLHRMRFVFASRSVQTTTSTSYSINLWPGTMLRPSF